MKNKNKYSERKYTAVEELFLEFIFMVIKKRNKKWIMINRHLKFIWTRHNWNDEKNYFVKKYKKFEMIDNEATKQITMTIGIFAWGFWVCLEFKLPSVYLLNSLPLLLCSMFSKILMFTRFKSKLSNIFIIF